MNTAEAITLWSLMLESPNVERRSDWLLGVKQVRTLRTKGERYVMSLFDDYVHLTGHKEFSLPQSEVQRLADLFDAKPTAPSPPTLDEVTALL